MDLDKLVDFSSMEGFKEAASVLDFLPEEEREDFLWMVIAVTTLV